MSMQLSPTQHIVLSHAIGLTGGEVVWFPENRRGGARAKVLGGLHNRGLIIPIGSVWRVTAEAYDALGLAPPGGQRPQAPALETEAAPPGLAPGRPIKKPAHGWLPGRWWRLDECVKPPYEAGKYSIEVMLDAVGRL